MKQSARDWTFQVLDADNVTWLTITELNDWEEDRGANDAITETTVFASAGQYEGQKMQIGASLKLSGFGDYNSSGVQAAGQARVEALNGMFANASLGKFRFRHSTQTLWTLWNTAFVQLGSRGGGNNDNSKWEATITRSGAATTM
jgi:hypothetical protein